MVKITSSESYLKEEEESYGTKPLYQTELAKYIKKKLICV